MLFQSYIFVFVFLPVSLGGYYLAGRIGDKAAKLWLVAVSFWFYGSFRLEYLLLLAAGMLLNYGIALGIRRKEKAGMRAGGLLAAGIAADLAALGYFKYMDFFIENWNHASGMDLPLLRVALPVGVSFFTFQQISYLADCYKGEIEGGGFLDYMLSIVYFPKLVEGPLVMYAEWAPQLAGAGKKKLDAERLMRGICLFVMGMMKKVVLADTFGGAVDYGYSNLEIMHGWDALLLVVFYALQLYFDFSGYCDMARGIGKMLGIEIPVNFDSPYQATNIVVFWKRWHITLNRFFTKYVYIPLGGNRRGQARMYLNLMIVFLLSGLWHGAGWNYIVWGAMHGVLYVITRFWQRRAKHDSGVINDATEKMPLWYRIKNRFVTIMSQIMLFAYVSIAWVYFRAQDIAQANRLLAVVLKGNMQKISLDMAECFQLDEFWYVLKVLHLDHMTYSRYILMMGILAAGLYLAMAGPNAALRMERIKYRAGSAVVLTVLMVWSILTFSGVSTFLYFNF